MQSIDVETTAFAAASGTTIAQLIERLCRSKRTAPADLLEEVENISYQDLDVAVFAHFRKSPREAFVHWWRGQCKTRCRTVSEFGDRLALLRGLAAVLEREIVVHSEKLGRLQKNLRDTRTALNGVTDEYDPQGIVDKLLNWLFADSRTRERDKRFADLAQSARETKLAIDKVEAESAALIHCRRELKKEVRSTEDRLRSVCRILGSRKSLEQALAKADLFEIADLDSVLHDLLQIAEAPEFDERWLADTLLSCAKRATLTGLKAITGAYEPRVDVIAQELTKEPPTLGPFWGGKRPMSVDSTVFVLPPVNRNLRAKLTAAFAPLVHYSDRFQLAFADTAEAGFGIVRLQVRHPKTYGEIVTPQIADEIDEIATRPHLYFPQNLDVDSIKQFTNGHLPEDAVPITPR